MSFSRRSFLKYAALSAGGTLLAETPFMGAKARAQAEGGKARYVPTTCEMCFWKCGVVAKVVDGKVVKLEGNPLHPQSLGKLCGRGQAGIGLLYDKDRLKVPMIRTGARGENRYKQASWDEALNYVAEKLTTIKGKYGAESIALFAHGSPGTYFANVVRALGSANISYPSFSQCLGARNVAWELTFGEAPQSTCERVDMANSRVIVLFGTHLGENMHNSQNQEFAQAVANGARIVVVDPRFSTAAGKASTWMPIKPGTDLALLLTWINLVITNGWYDKDYVNNYTNGFDKLAAEVKHYTPEWAARETELPEHDIVEVARALGRNAPNVMVHPGRHFSWHGNDTQRGRAMAILNALLGTWGRPGGIWLSPKGKLAKLTEHPAYPEPKRDSVVFGDYPFAGGEGLTNVVRETTISGDPYPIKAWIVTGTNLLKTMPNQEKTRKAIDKLDLLVSIDVMPTDTVMMADVILPECSYLERHDGLFGIETREAGVAIRQPVIEPLYQSKPAWWIGSQLCRALKLDDYAVKGTWEERMRREAKLWNIDYQELADKGYLSIPGSAAPYFTADNPPTFKTKSKKIELYSAELEDESFAPIPKYQAIEQPPAGQYRLLYGRSQVHTFSRTVNNQWLWELFKENQVWLNAKEAARLGLKDLALVRLVNQDGINSEPVRVKVTERIRPDCVYMVHGFGQHSPAMTRAYNRGADDQHLISKYKIDPICGTTGMRVNFVKIVKEA
ncbi:MAG: molybdopterin-dependent oxidoreductase [Desulfobacteraceae bacterium]|nr:molybdopterin-dependent oxidoreductase [Desulfobacteraceae bacterium]